MFQVCFKFAQNLNALPVRLLTQVRPRRRLADFSKTAILLERGAKNGIQKRSYIGCLLESILGPISEPFWEHFGSILGHLEGILGAF